MMMALFNIMLPYSITYNTYYVTMNIVNISVYTILFQQKYNDYYALHLFLYAWNIAT